MPGRALGLDNVAPPSDRVTVGQIGVGNRGIGLFRSTFGLPNAQFVAISDCYKSKRDSVAAIAKATAYQDCRDLIARDDIDAVIIATPDHNHVPIGIAAARAGKDVFIEKPLGISIEDDLAMQKVIEETGQVFQYGTQQRSMPHCWKGCELVRQGKIGQIKSIELEAPDGGEGGSTVASPVPKDLDFDAWCGRSPMRPYTPDLCKQPGSYWVYSQSIGYLAGWGAHPLDIMVWASDVDTRGPICVEGTGTIPTEGLYDCVIHWDMKITMGDVVATFKPGADRTKFVGEDGWVQVARDAGRCMGSEPELNPRSNGKIDLTEDSLQVSTNHMADFIDSVQTRKQPVANIRDAVRGEVISQLCDIAVRTGEKITWDPKKRELVDPSDAAKAMLSRPLRGSWTL
ncbi:NADH-dependent dehydrogenase [Rhodopirellula sp. SWK7]|nr:NADH-dependent dehydrogenase [Rhodopirellula sp. SWK7]